MGVESLAWMGIHTEKFDETVRLFRDLLGMELTGESAGIARFRLTNGTQVEVYGPEDEFHSFFSAGAVVAFRVRNVDEMRERMEAAGVEFIGPVQWNGTASWSHFRGPDGTVFEILSTD